MPKVSNKIDYTTTPISFYKFVCEDETNESCYVGSTSNFRSRKARHKSACNNPNDKKHHLKVYQTIRENGGWECWNMIEISNQICESKRHSDRIEQEFMTKLKTDMNTQNPICQVDKHTYDKKYWLDNVDKIRLRNRQYWREHADEFNAKARAKRQAKKELLKGMS